MMRSLHRDSTIRAGFVALAVVYVLVALLTALRASGAASVTQVKVTPGKPTEYRFIVTPSTGLAVGAVRFVVTNAGKQPHQFKVCGVAVTAATLKTCVGKATRLLKPGQTATLLTSFPKAGKYEYLSTPVDAAKGMKGLLVAKVAVVSTPITTASVTRPSTTPVGTTPTVPAVTTTSGSASGSAGQIVWTNVGCGSCHSLTSLKGNVNSSLNSTHPEPFPGGALSQKQIADVAAYINGS